MTDIEFRNEFSKVAIATLFLIDAEDNLRTNKKYRFNLKRTGQMFLKELLKFENYLYTGLENTNATEEEKRQFFDEFVESSKAMSNLMEVQMNFKNDNQREQFNEDLNKLITKYNLM